MHLDVATGGELARRAARRVPGGADRVPRQQQVRRRAARRAASAGVGRIVVDSFDELDRIEAPRRRGLPGAAGAGAGHAGGRGAHPRVHRHRRRRLEVRLHRVERRRARGRGCAVAQVRRDGASPASTATSGRRSSCSSRSRSRPRWWRALAAEVRDATPASPVDELNLGGGLGGALHRRRSRRAVDRRVRPRACAPTSPARARRPASTRRPVLTVEAGRSIAGPAGLTLYTVGTIKEIPGRRAPTSRSTAA